MKFMTIRTALLSFCLLFCLVACAKSTPATPLPTAEAVITAVPPTPIPVEPTATVEVAAATSTVDTAVIPTEIPPTATAEPTLIPTEPAPEPTAVSVEPIVYNIIVESPQPNQAMDVAREFTFSGRISPVPSHPVELLLTADDSANSGETVIASANVDPETGQWTTTEPLHPRRTGPATLYVRAADTSVTVPVVLQLARDEATVIVTVNQPLAGDVVVAGHTVLISGESRNLIDDKIQIGLFGCSEEDDNVLAQIEFEAGNGPWRAQIILPTTAADNCDSVRLLVKTGGLTSNEAQVAWASDQLLTVVPTTDERATILDVWELTGLHFSPGQATAVAGTAVNPIDGVIQVQLVQGDGVLATKTAVPDQFGFWQTNLTPPANTDLNGLYLRLTTGEGETYREQDFPIENLP